MIKEQFTTFHTLLLSHNFLEVSMQLFVTEMEEVHDMQRHIYCFTYDSLRLYTGT